MASIITQGWTGVKAKLGGEIQAGTDERAEQCAAEAAAVPPSCFAKQQTGTLYLVRTQRSDRWISSVVGHESAALAQWPGTYMVDAAAYFSRPGPRLLDGVELLAYILHPSPFRPLEPQKAVLLSPSLFALEPQHDAR